MLAIDGSLAHALATLVALAQSIEGILLTLALTAIIIVLGRIVESRNPIVRGLPRSELVLDYKLVFINIFLNGLFARYVGAVGAIVIGAAGGGLVSLRSDGLWFVVTTAVAILTTEFVSYWFHRAQHAIPFLWSMHSLHHSAEALTITTGARHFWFESIFPMGIIPVTALIIKVPHDVIRILPLIYVLENLAHLNVKVSAGRFILCIVSPQFHRIHHSAEPQHIDKNFCKLLPIIDVIFGTAWVPKENEFPRTGLISSAKPAGIWDGIIWPLRKLGGLREARNLASQGAAPLRT